VTIECDILARRQLQTVASSGYWFMRSQKCRLIGFSFRQNPPRYAGEFAGQCHYSDIVVSAGGEFA
jgi:hypothetical protein